MSAPVVVPEDPAVRIARELAAIRAQLAEIARLLAVLAGEISPGDGR